MKLGIISYTNKSSGLGVFAKECVDNLGIEDILSINSVKGRETWTHKQVDTSNSPSTEIVYDWLKQSNIDVLLTLETPFNRETYSLTKKLGIKSIIFINHEFFYPDDIMWQDCDMFICPNTSAYSKAEQFKDKRLLCKFPIDISKFPYRKRTGKTFIHVAGYFNFMKRKSVDEIVLAFNRSKADKLIIYMQESIEKLDNETQKILSNNNRIEVIPERENYFDLYTEGDIAIQPSKFEGYGRTIIEPLACGIPTITVDADPMNTYFNEPSFLLPVTRTEEAKIGNFRFIKNHFSVENLINKINWCVENDITFYSKKARKRIEKYYNWDKERDFLLKEILKEV